MTTSDRTDLLIARMLRTRADGDPPAWLLDSTMRRVAVTPQARGGLGPRLVPPATPMARAAIILAAALALLGLAIGGTVASRLLEGPPRLPAVVVQPSMDPARSDDGAVSASPGASAAPSPTATARSSASVASVAAKAWTLPAGWRHDLECADAEDGSTSCVLHLLDAAGHERDGWPVTLGGGCWYGVAVGPDNSVFVPCRADAAVVVNGLDQNGRALPGWPVRLAGEDVSQAEVDPRGTVYVGVTSAGTTHFALHALAPEGTERAGLWPVTLPGGAQGFTLSPDGTAVAWWYEGIAEGTIDLQAKRTVFTMLARDGSTLRGWPNGSVGAATLPAVWTDGSIYYTSATAKVWGLNRAGERIEGWPYQLPSIVTPELRSDGTLLFVSDSRVDVLSRNGKTVSGWPYRTMATFDEPGCVTDALPAAVAARSTGDRLYLATWDGDRAAVIALDPDGGMADGWPYRVPPGWRVVALSADAKGGVTVQLSGDSGCGADMDATSIRLASSGRLVGSAPPTPLRLVYAAMRLTDPRTSSGDAAFDQGAVVDVEFELVNRSKGEVVLPLVDYYGESFYAAGTIQTWVERLGSDSELMCLPNAGRKGSWYGIGGWINVTREPMAIGSGEAMGSALAVSLQPSLTSCLPPGGYRLHVEYKPLDGSDDEVIDERAIDILITSAATPPPASGPVPTAVVRSPSTPPTPTPVPTERPSPGPTSPAPPSPASANP